MYSSKEKQYALFNLKTKQIEKETIGNCVLDLNEIFWHSSKLT